MREAEKRFANKSLKRLVGSGKILKCGCSSTFLGVVLCLGFAVKAADSMDSQKALLPNAPPASAPTTSSVLLPTATSVSSAVSASQSDTLNRQSIHAAYTDGEFDATVKALEEFRIAHPDCRREDSLVYAKYLGVIYASNPATREKGKYWLYKLLQIDPSAELIDLYVSEEIQNLFDRVRREQVVRRRYRGINDADLRKTLAAEDAKDTVVVRDTVLLKEVGLQGTLQGLATSLQTPAPVFVEAEKANPKSWTFDVNLLAGLKWMDPIAWKPIHHQFAFQGSFDFRRMAWPVNLNVSFAQTVSKEVLQYNSTGGLEANRGYTQELFFGLRKFWDIRLLSLRPYFDLGLGMIAVTFESDAFTTFEDHAFKQTGYGVSLGGGLYYELEKHFNIGGNFWYGWVPIDYFAGTANGGGTGFGLMAGFHY